MPNVVDSAMAGGGLPPMDSVPGIAAAGVGPIKRSTAKPGRRQKHKKSRNVHSKRKAHGGRR